MIPNQVSLTTFEKIKYYSFGVQVLTIFSLPILTAPSSILENYFYLIFYLLLIVWIVYTYVLLFNGLKYNKFKIGLSDKQFANAFNATALFHGWEFYPSKKNEFKARSFSDNQDRGFTIQVIKSGNKIGYTTFVTPSFFSNPFTLGRRGKIYSALLKMMKYELDGIDSYLKAKELILANELEFLKSNEWNFKKTLRRFSLYFLCSLLIAPGLYLLTQGEFVGLFMIIIGSLYLIIDSVVLVKKYKYNKK